MTAEPNAMFSRETDRFIHAELLAGWVPVAHNLAFDTGFLIAEYGRLGAEIPMTGRSGLCTMQMAGHYFPIPRRFLAACCRYIEYTLIDAHAALVDAQAAATLLGHYLRYDGREFPRRWRSSLESARKARWPKLFGGVRSPLSRTDRKAAAPKHSLARLAEGASPSFVTADVEPYVEALDRALLNRNISRHEADELVTVARSVGLGRNDVLEVHRRCLHALCVQAWADGVVTSKERADLRRVQQLLGLQSIDLDELLSEARADPGQGTDMKTDSSQRIRTASAAKRAEGCCGGTYGRMAESPGVAPQLPDVKCHVCGTKIRFEKKTERRGWFSWLWV